MIAEVPTLLSDDYASPAPDIILHLGMAPGRTFYTLERTAYRDGYEKLKDVEGAIFTKEENAEIWGRCPEILQPGWDCEDVWRRWRDCTRADLDVRPSDDPGNFLCGFIYYASLAHLWKVGHGSADGHENPVREHARAWNVQPERVNGATEKRPKKLVMFLHVPDIQKMGHVSNGVEATEGLILALVESRRSGRCGGIVDGSSKANGRRGGEKERDMDSMW